jgi:hypothetical protein
MFQSSNPRCEIVILDNKRSTNANKAREAPTIEVIEIILDLSRNGWRQIIAIIFLVATNVRLFLQSQLKHT